MSTAIWILAGTTVLLVLLAGALSEEKIRERLIGTSKARAALVPLFAAGGLWGAAFSTDFLKSRIEDGTVPADVLAAFVENISFGFPSVSLEVFTRDFTRAEKRQELAPFRFNNDPVSLSATELERLNEISRKSGQIEDVDPTRTLTTSGIANVLEDPINFGYNYGQWAAATKSWSDLLRQTPAGTPKQATASALTERIREVTTAAGIFQGIVGMVSRQTIKIPEPTPECLKDPTKIATAESSEGRTYLNFPTFRSFISGRDDLNDRKSASKDLAILFETGCFSALAELFSNASQIYSQEQKLLRQYVEEWNRILSAKQAETITIRVALANIGRFDSFVRKQAKVAVGPKGASEKITFTVSMREKLSNSKEEGKSEDSPSSEYLQVKSRATETITLQAKLPADVQKKIYGAFQSEQTFLRIGFLASAGSTEEEVFTQPIPFSTKAQSLSRDRVQAIQVKF